MDEILQAIIEVDDTLMKERERISRMKRKVYGREANTCQAVVEATSDTLHLSVDGHGLIAHHEVPICSLWVSSGTSLLSGSGYIHAVQVRANSLYTLGRTSRGRNLRWSGCDACAQYESLGNIV